MQGVVIINSVSKVLYQLYGYTQTHTFFPPDLDEIRKKLLTEFDKNESYVGSVHEEVLPPHIENLSDVVFAQLLFSSSTLWNQWYELMMQQIIAPLNIYADLSQLNKIDLLT